MINGNEILDLMYKPMYDEKVLEMMEKLEMKVPELDEKYQLDGSISTYNDKIGFTFRELDGYSNNGEPCTVGISFTKSINVDLPYKLNFNDNYLTCITKIGKKADYLNDWDDYVKIWILQNKAINTALAINYTDKSFENIRSIVFFYFDETEIGEIYIPNEE